MLHNCDVYLIISDMEVPTLPERKVKAPMDVGKWKNSQAYKRYMDYLGRLNTAVTGKSCMLPAQVSTNVQTMCDLLGTLESWISEIPPQEQPQRFGNLAFRDWYARLGQNVDALLENGLPIDKRQFVVELTPYLLDSFGNSTRIDYGTGHEAAFVMFLCCLSQIGYFSETDDAAVVTKVFTKYANLCRNLQRTYKMEPAGSHGVWSLDDYHFITFIWGSAQLIGQSDIEPEQLADKVLAEKFADQYIFMACIKYINEVKTGPFFEHSNQLYNISGVSGGWNKVNSGLIKMYEHEILSKFPVVQHFVFGSLLPFKPV